MAFFQIFASDTGLNDDELVVPPAASENFIPGVLNSFALVDEEGNLMSSIALTCAGEEKPRLIGIPTFLSGAKCSRNISWWSVPRAPFRINAPIYFHRLTRPYKDFH